MDGTLEAPEASPDVLSPPGKAPKIPALDGLRALAIILVLMSHMGLDKLVPGGFGVTIFFFPQRLPDHNLVAGGIGERRQNRYQEILPSPCFANLSAALYHPHAVVNLHTAGSIS